MAMPGDPTGGFDVVSFTTKGELEVYEKR
jgi:hypothetical protein